MTLVCRACGAAYLVVREVPSVIPSSSALAYDLDVEGVQSSYAYQFAPWLIPGPVERWASVVRPRVKSHDPDPGQMSGMEGVSPSSQGHRNGLDEALDTLFSTTGLAEEFYQRITSICSQVLHPGGAALDVGCGLGRMTLEMARCGAGVAIGVDVSLRLTHEAARLARARAPVDVGLTLATGKSIAAKLALGGPIDCDFVTANAQWLPFESESFDLVLALNLVDRVPDPMQAVKEAARVLKRGGHVLVSDPYDWQERHTPRDRWVDDLSELVDREALQVVGEWDGLPMVLRRSARQMMIHLNHSVLYRKR
ncbi:MAG: SAM-dependent methyltransferase [Chloroflexi bacterium]|nr:SAM-dependent methyltransferase [Chloroflexota bacterium]